MKKNLTLLFIIFFFLIWCQQEPNRAPDYNLVSKCWYDARSYFKENWARNNDTLLLDYRNHFNQNLNKCFILIEYNYYVQKEKNRWDKSIVLYDVSENLEYWSFWEQENSLNNFIDCNFLGSKCFSLTEFMKNAQKYMSN